MTMKLKSYSNGLGYEFIVWKFSRSYVVECVNKRGVVIWKEVYDSEQDALDAFNRACGK
jgi:hypothetical protein